MLHPSRKWPLLVKLSVVAYLRSIKNAGDIVADKNKLTIRRLGFRRRRYNRRRTRRGAFPWAARTLPVGKPKCSRITKRGGDGRSQEPFQVNSPLPPSGSPEPDLAFPALVAHGDIAVIAAEENPIAVGDDVSGRVDAALTVALPQAQTVLISVMESASSMSLRAPGKSA